MVLMAGMLPGVECARRRRLRPAGSSGEAPCAWTRLPSSFCLYAANGHDHAHLGSAGFPKQSSACEETAWTTLDSNAREAKERLDQKLRSQRESVVKRHHSTGSLRLPASTSESDHSAKEATAASVLQREVFSKKGGGRRFSWGSMGARKAASPELQAAAGGVRGVPGGVPRGGRAGSPPLRAPLPLGLRRALDPGRLPLPLLPRRRPPGRRRLINQPRRTVPTPPPRAPARRRCA